MTELMHHRVVCVPASMKNDSLRDLSRKCILILSIRLRSQTSVPEKSQRFMLRLRIRMVCELFSKIFISVSDLRKRLMLISGNSFPRQNLPYPLGTRRFGVGAQMSAPVGNVIVRYLLHRHCT